MQNTMRAHSTGQKRDVFGVALTSEGTSSIAISLFDHFTNVASSLQLKPYPALYKIKS